MWCQGPNILIKLIVGSIFSKKKSGFVFVDLNLDTNQYIEILLFSLSEMNKIMKNSVILQFDNDPKHRSLKAFEFYKKNNIEIIDWPSNSPDLNSIEDIWLKMKNKLCRQEFERISKLRKRVEKK